MKLFKRPELKDDYDNGTAEEYDVNITNSDYGFILDSDGDLKALFLPLNYYNTMPDKVYAVLKLFGVDDPDSISVYFNQ
jgi:hypothetical protein